MADQFKDRDQDQLIKEGPDKMKDTDGERLARIEEGVKSLGRSLDSLKETFVDHLQDSKLVVDRLGAVEVEQAETKGKITGSKWMLSIVAGLAGVALFLGWKSHG